MGKPSIGSITTKVLDNAVSEEKKLTILERDSEDSIYNIIFTEKKAKTPELKNEQ